MNADLAGIYQVAGTFDDEYQEVELDATKRAGLLTRAGFLARNATLTEPDPIHRGVFVNMNVLCRLISAPPVIPEDLKPTGATNRERVTSVTGPGTCGEGCHHTMINPIGFAFENFDAIGKYRAMDNGVAVDSAAIYTFADGRSISYGNAIELSRALAAAPETHRCYTSNVLELTLARALLLSDRVIVNALATRSLKEQLSVQGAADDGGVEYRIPGPQDRKEE